MTTALTVKDFQREAEEIKEIFNRVKQIEKQVVGDYLKVGKNLAKVKGNTKHGEYLNFLQEVGIDKSNASRFVKAYEIFGENPPNVTWSIIRELITLDEDTRQKLLESGIEDMTVKEVKEAKKALTAPTDKEVKPCKNCKVLQEEIERLQAQLEYYQKLDEQTTRLITEKNLEIDTLKNKNKELEELSGKQAERIVNLETELTKAKTPKAPKEEPKQEKQQQNTTEEPIRDTEAKNTNEEQTENNKEKKRQPRFPEVKDRKSYIRFNTAVISIQNDVEGIFKGDKMSIKTASELIITQIKCMQSMERYKGAEKARITREIKKLINDLEERAA